MWGTEFIRKLKPCHWKYRDTPLNDGKIHFGFIAQDIDEIACKKDYGFVGQKEGYLTINYHELIGPIVKTLQEYDERIKKLEKKK